jgi:hypothetical protein
MAKAVSLMTLACQAPAASMILRLDWSSDDCSGSKAARAVAMAGRHAFRLYD